jgi:hypothetical protein
MLRRGRGSGSLRTGKPGAILGRYRSKAVALSSRKRSACFEAIFCLGPTFGLGLKWKGKERTTMKDDVYDIPMVYLLYVLIAIAGIVAAAVIVIIRML